MVITVPYQKSPLQTQLIGFKIKYKDIIVWEQVCDKLKTTLTDFLLKAVDLYLHPNTPNPFKKVEIQQDLTKYAKDGNKYVNLRVEKETLREWDDFCARHIISRTSLIKQAVRHSLQPPEKILPNFEFERACQEILYNMINYFGLMDGVTFHAIFSPIQRKTRSKILNNLEAARLVLRKGADVYVPHEPSVVFTDPRLITENLVYIFERIQENPDEIDESYHARLLRVFFEYMEQLANQKGIGDKIYAESHKIMRTFERAMNISLTDVKNNE